MKPTRSLKSLPINYRQQSGVVLIVGLVMVLMLTIIGLASIRGSGMQEMMAGNMRDHNLSFQAAEAGLRSAEAGLTSHTQCQSGFNNNSGCYTDLSLTNPVINWQTSDWLDNNKAVAVGDVNLNDISHAPKVVVEQLSVAAGGNDQTECADWTCFNGQSATTEVLRITSLGYGGSENAQTIIQTTYRR